MKTVMLQREEIAQQDALHLRVLRSDRVLVLLLGIISTIAGVLIGSLGSAFIDNILIGKDFDRAPPIILWYVILSAMIFALDYSFERMLKLRQNTPGWVKPRYFSFRISTFAILMNGLLICILSNMIALLCLTLLGVVYIALFVHIRTFNRQISYEASDTICAILRVCILFICGLFVMHGSITLGNLFAVNAFSGKVFSTALSLMRQSLRVGGSANSKEPEPDKAPTEVSFHLLTLVKSIWKDKLTIFCTLFLALIGTVTNGIFLLLQKMNFSDYIPSGDWSNLLLNCIFMACLSICTFFAQKGNAIGFNQIFNGKVPVYIEENLNQISSLFLSIVFAIYYGFQIRQYNELLASRMTIGTIAVCVAFMLLAYSPHRSLWGERFNKLLDILSRFLQRCLTAFLYCIIALEITTVPIGVFFVFLTAFNGFFYGAVNLSKMLAMFLDVRESKNGELHNALEKSGSR